VEFLLEGSNDMDTAIVICYYKNSEHFLECFESIKDIPDCDFYVVENKSNVDISEKILKYVENKKIKSYALFEQNIYDNAPRLFFMDGNVKFTDYKYVVYTDGDLVPDKGWLDECKKTLDNNKDLFVIATSLYMDNLPIKSFPEAVNWIPPNVIDQGDYLETRTGCSFMTFRSEDFEKYVEHNSFLILDTNIHNYAKSIGKKSGRTKTTKSKHLTWDYYQDRNHPYTQERLSNTKIWGENKTCPYKVFKGEEMIIPLVTVCCTTYNHVNFIRQAVDGFLMQKTSFPFEILIHDDASTDGTTEILKEYAKKNSNIRLVLQKENQYKKGMLSGMLFGYDPFSKNILPLARGKFIAMCEGDDYWVDPGKLQKQVDFLQSNPQHIMCYHPCKTLHNNQFAFYGLGERGRDYEPQRLVAAPGGIATSTKMFRNIYSEKTKEDFINFSGDFLFNSYMGTHGSCGFIKDVIPSIYRIHEGGVWTGMNGNVRKVAISNMYNKMYELHLKKGNAKNTSIVKRYVKIIEDQNPMFAVIIPTYQRSDGKTPYYLKRTLDSVFAQTCKDFKIYLIGDKYTHVKEVLDIVKKYPRNKIYFENLSVAVEREKYTDNREALWCSGGTNATNYGLEKAFAEGVNYVCLLDHDDYWLPDHLKSLNQVFLDTSADWICTKTKVDSKSGYLPRNVVNKPLIDFLPLPCGIIKSSVCFNMFTIPLRVRDVFGETGKAIPGDADLWERSAKYIKENHLKSYFLNKFTCIHDSEGYVRYGGFDMKAPLFDLLSDVSIITCTGDRPESFELLRRWMSKQTIKPKQWIVIDDGKVPLTDTSGFDYYRRVPSDKDYLHTLCLNLPIAMEKVICKKVIIMEDDDWYHPTYIDYMSNLLDKADLVGFANLIFYYPSLQKYMIKGTAKQPALAQTAFRKEIIPIVQKICNSAPSVYDLCGKGLVDAELWKNSLSLFKDERSIRLTTSLKVTSGQVIEKGTMFYPPIPLGIVKRADRRNGAEHVVSKRSIEGRKLIVRCEEYLSVGMKGLPGRKGLTTHHNENNGKYKMDPDYKLLKSIIKDDLQFYLKIIV